MKWSVFSRTAVLVCGLCGLFLVPATALDKTAYRVAIVSDTLDVWAADTQAGFRQALDEQLATHGASATYTVYDTKVDPANTPAILKAIRDAKPDLVLVCNYPNGFADSQITSKLGAAFKVVSLNPIPVEIGLIQNWQKPGGNVTGVGVFLQFASPIRLALRINPKLKNVAFVTWDAMGQVNDWFEAEMKRAAAETGVRLVEFRRVTTNEDELAFYSEYSARAADTFVMEGISAFVHRDGSPVDAARDWNPFIQKELGRLLFISYDDSTVARGVPASTAVIWTDLGAQLADKALKILQGAHPGDLPWEYPRKYNVVLNLQAAKDRGLSFPPVLISAAYRVYTDYQGHFVGQK